MIKSRQYNSDLQAESPPHSKAGHTHSKQNRGLKRSSEKWFLTLGLICYQYLENQTNGIGKELYW
jgi:hypothetical protein